ncbi:MAG TPA: CHAT domain-containing tetratricopeptide repeat protein [Thermoanaerobaculia bacterium]|jgi:CHAT domain-containing protein/Tfp pilus assembly protein PilF
MAKRKKERYNESRMFVLPFLLLALLETTDASARAEELAAAMRASDVGAVTRLWSDTSPSRNPDRKRLVRLMGERPHITTSAEANAIRLELRDAAGTLLEQYSLPLVWESGSSGSSGSSVPRQDAAAPSEEPRGTPRNPRNPSLPPDGEWRIQSLTPIPAPDGSIPFARELIHRGTEQTERGEFQAAQQSFGRAIAIGDALGHASTRWLGRRGLGTVALTAGDPTTATKLFEEMKAIAEAASDRRGVARALDRLASVDWKTGEFARARARYEEALQIHRELGDRLFIGTMHLGLGNVYSVQGRQREGREYYEEALRIFEAAGDIDSVASILNNLGVTHRLQGRYAESAAHFTRVLQMARATDDLEGVAFAQGNLGTALAMQGRLTEALLAYDKALELNERLGRAQGQMVMLTNLGELYRMLGNYAQARNHFERAHALAVEAQFAPDIALGLHNLGALRRDEGDFAGSLELLQKSLAMSEKMQDQHGISLALHGIGMAHFSAGDRASARKAFERVFTVAESMDDLETMSISLGMRSELAENPADAIALGQRSLALSEEMGLPERLWNSHLGLGRAYRRAGKRIEAQKQIEQAISVIEEWRRGIPGDETTQQQAFELMVRPYHEMVGLLVEAGDVVGAFEYAERAKARALLDVLRNGRPELGDVLTESERQRDAELTGELAELNRRYREALVGGGQTTELAAQLRIARLQYDAFLTSLYGAHPQLRIEAGEIAPVRTSDVALLLDGGAADVLLEFVVTDERTYLFTMKRGRELRAHTIVIPRDELQKEVRRFRELLANRDITYGPASRALYDRLLRGIAPELRGAKTVAIVADGPLWELPFQALQPKNGEFLLDQHAIYYVPSLTVLREMSARRTPRARRSLLAIGNPLLPKKGLAQLRGDAALPPLPQTESEIRGIAPLYNNRRVHLGGDAREDVVKSEAQTFDVLHFATHAVLDDHNALYSRLVLSPSGEREDGLLEAREIMRLDLNADMAVLSACETARGRVGEGEGLIGMSWALFVAGVPTSVVSQWKVDSQSTSELMIDFHRALRGSPRSKAEALRYAALKTKARAAYRHPFYWAPFVVVGSAR